MIDDINDQVPNGSDNSIIFGYARVSTKNQKLDIQTSALKKYGCQKIYTETASTRGRLPELELLIDNLRKGDTLVVWKLDRLGRSVREVVNLVHSLIDKGITLKSTTLDIDIGNEQLGKIFVYMYAIFAEMERSFISERTIKGLEEARKRGVKGGARHKLTKDQIKEARIMYESKEYTMQEIADKFDVTRQTIYNNIKSNNS